MKMLLSNTKIVLVVACTLLFLFYGCKKDYSEEAVLSLSQRMIILKDEVQKLKIESKLTSRLNDTLNIKWAPNWDEVENNANSEGKIYYYIPLVPSAVSLSDSKKYYPVSRYLFNEYLIAAYTNDSNLTFVKASYIWPPIADIDIKEKESYSTIEMNHTSFTGKVILDDLNGHQNLIYYRDGKQDFSNRNKARAVVAGGEFGGCSTRCTWSNYCPTDKRFASGAGMMTVTVTTGFGGFCSSPPGGLCDDGQKRWSLSYTESIACMPIFFSPPPIPPIGGGGTATSPTLIRDVLNNLTSPCFKSVLKEINNGTLQNQVSKILSNTFGKTDKINVRFYESSLSDDIDGDTQAQPIEVGGVTTWNMDITLNTKLLTKFGSSKEYIAATILHEVIHAYFRAIKSNPLIDHNEMGLFYIDHMASGLQEIYPSMNKDDATALAWGGVNESYSWGQLLTKSPDAAKEIIKKNENYRSSKSGTKCD